MPYRVKTSKKFDKFLANHQDLMSKILKSFREIAQDPYNNPLDIKKLKGKENKIA